MMLTSPFRTVDWDAASAAHDNLVCALATTLSAKSAIYQGLSNCIDKLTPDNVSKLVNGFLNWSCPSTEGAMRSWLECDLGAQINQATLDRLKVKDPQKLLQDQFQPTHFFSRRQGKQKIMVIFMLVNGYLARHPDKNIARPIAELLQLAEDLRASEPKLAQLITAVTLCHPDVVEHFYSSKLETSHRVQLYTALRKTCATKGPDDTASVDDAECITASPVSDVGSDALSVAASPSAALIFAPQASDDLAVVGTTGPRFVEPPTGAGAKTMPFTGIECARLVAGVTAEIAEAALEVAAELVLG